MPSASAEEEIAVVRNTRESLAEGGWVVASVMNANVVMDRLPDVHRPRSVEEFVAALEALAP